MSKAYSLHANKRISPIRLVRLLKTEFGPIGFEQNDIL